MHFKVKNGFEKLHKIEVKECLLLAANDSVHAILCNNSPCNS